MSPGLIWNKPYLRESHFVIRQHTDSAISIIDKVLNPQTVAATRVGGVWTRPPMLKRQDNVSTITSQQCEPGCNSPRVTHFMLKSESGCIPTGVSIEGSWHGSLTGNQIHRQTRMWNRQQFPSFAFKALFYWQAFLAPTRLYTWQPERSFFPYERTGANPARKLCEAETKESKISRRREQIWRPAGFFYNKFSPTPLWYLQKGADDVSFWLKSKSNQWHFWNASTTFT